MYRFNCTYVCFTFFFYLWVISLYGHMTAEVRGRVGRSSRVDVADERAEQKVGRDTKKRDRTKHQGQETGCARKRGERKEKAEWRIERN